MNRDETSFFPFFLSSQVGTKDRNRTCQRGRLEPRPFPLSDSPFSSRRAGEMALSLPPSLSLFLRHCDGLLYRKQEVIVVGGGQSLFFFFPLFLTFPPLSLPRRVGRHFSSHGPRRRNGIPLSPQCHPSFFPSFFQRERG